MWQREDQQLGQIMTEYSQYVEDIKKAQKDLSILPDDIGEDIKYMLDEIAAETAKEDNEEMRKIGDLYSSDETIFKKNLKKIKPEELKKMKETLNTNTFQRELVKDQLIDNVLSGHNLVDEFSKTTKCTDEKRDLKNIQKLMNETIEKYEKLDIDMEENYIKYCLELEKSVVKQENIIKQTRQKYWYELLNLDLRMR